MPDNVPGTDKTSLVLLGTGTPNAEPDRAGSALAVIVGDTPYLVDFGPGVVRRATAARQAGIEALRPANLRHAFLTHLHSDHTAGYADLILTPWVLGRDAPLTVCGPVGLASMTGHLLEAYMQDIHERLHGLEPANKQGYRVDAREISPGVCWQDAHVTVEAFPVQHGSWPAFGYKFTSADRTIVVSGDTCPVETLVEQAAGCDILVHEVYSDAGFRLRPAMWQEYHAAVHTSASQLAEIASRVQPGLLVLVHQLRWGVSEDALLEEVRAGYAGEVAAGHDLDVF